MILISCPNCGPRDETEYHYGGQAHVAVPGGPGRPHRRGVGRYLFYRENPKGPFAERWVHTRRLPQVVQRGPRHRHLPDRRPSTGSPTRVPRLSWSELDEHDQSHRLATGGRIDRTTALTFTVDGQEYTGHPGDTLASALLANGVLETGTSLYRGRPRGILAAGRRGAQRAGQRPTSRATCDRVHASRHDRGAGRRAGGRLPVRPRRARPGRRHRRSTTRSTSTPTSSSSAPARPGSPRPREAAAHRRPRDPDRRPARARRLAAVRPAAPSDRRPAGAASGLPRIEPSSAPAPRCTVLTRTNAFGSYDANYVIAVQNRTDHLGAAATGRARRGLAAAAVAHPGPAGGPRHRRARASAGVRRQRPPRRHARLGGPHLPQPVRRGRRARVVVATTNDSAYAIAADLTAAGVEVAAVVDARTELSDAARRRPGRRHRGHPRQRRGRHRR